MLDSIFNNKLFNNLSEKVIHNYPYILWGLILIVLGWGIATFCKKIVLKSLNKTKVDQTIVGFASSLCFFLVFGFFILAALTNFGIETTSILALLGTAGLALGLALQNTLANFSAGLFIILFRPFKIGDFIEAAGVNGSVKQIGLFATTLSEIDNVEVIVPNNKLYDDVIRNFSSNQTRRIDLTIGISYNNSIDKASSLLFDLLNSKEQILDNPKPKVFVKELSDSSVNLELRAWTKNEDYWDTKLFLNKKIKQIFDEKGIEIPYPHQVIELKNKMNDL